MSYCSLIYGIMKGKLGEWSKYMKIKIIYVMAVALCVGCETLMEIGSPSVCSHENMTVYRSNVFSDGQHYLFKDGKLAALANVKDGYAEGKFAWHRTDKISADTGATDLYAELEMGYK